MIQFMKGYPQYGEVKAIENIDNFDQWLEKSKELWKKKKVAIKHLSNVSIEIK